MRYLQYMQYLRAVTLAGISLLLLMCVAACAGTATAHMPSSPTASAPVTSTATLPPIPMRAITFLTSDHLLLDGVFLGSGHTVIIFSNQTDSFASDWLPIARQFAARGYAGLVYDYRGTRSSQGVRDFAAGPTDLKAAIAFAQQQGAHRIILVGASIGGTITATVASVVPTAAVVIISSPHDLLGLKVTDQMMQAIAAPKFLAVGQGDDYAPDVQAMYDAANPPKELQVYPGGEHGLDLFTGSNGPDILRRLFTFFQHYVPVS